ncbi:hypothetical protein ACQJBY_017158 [Aegilops geniculata]
MATADLRPPSLEAAAAADGGGGGGRRRGAVAAQRPAAGDELLGGRPRHLLLHQGSVREPPRRLHRRHLHRLRPHGVGRYSPCSIPYTAPPPPPPRTLYAVVGFRLAVFLFSTIAVVSKGRGTRSDASVQLLAAEP